MKFLSIDSLMNNINPFFFHRFLNSTKKRGGRMKKKENFFSSNRLLNSTKERGE